MCGSLCGLLRAAGDYKGNERKRERVSECVVMGRVEEDSLVVAGDAVVDATL